MSGKSNFLITAVKIITFSLCFSLFMCESTFTSWAKTIEVIEDIDDDQDSVVLDDDIFYISKSEKKTKDNGWIKKTADGVTKYQYKAPKAKKIAKGRVKIGLNYYYFDNKGYLINNEWIKKAGKNIYHAGNNGILAIGFERIDGFEYYFKENNELAHDLHKELGSDWYENQKLKIMVNKAQNIVTIYALGSSGKYDMPVRRFACTSGVYTPILSTELLKKNTYRWRELMGPCYGQFSTRIHKGVLFHSVLYRRPNKYTLNARAYNKLGITASHGCIRLATGDAKRIYDDVNRLGKIKLTIYSNPNEKSVFGKPSTIKVPLSQTYDPTDPTVKEN